MNHLGLVFYELIGRRLVMLLQADPIDPNNPAYKAGQYCAGIFIVVFALAVIYAIHRRSKR